MDTSTIHRHRFACGVLAGALLLVPLAACSEDTTTSGTATTDTSAPAGDTGTTDTTAPEGTAAPSDPSGTDAGVDCTGTSCSLTLTGDGAQADVLGTQVSLGTVQDGRATVRVGDREVSCSQGESVSAGPLTLECTTITADAVTLTASLG